mgnify:CR=1 FL=1
MYVVYISKEAPSQFFPPSGRDRRKLLVSPLVHPDPEPYARTVAQMTAHPGQEQTVNRCYEGKDLFGEQKTTHILQINDSTCIFRET